MMDFLKSLFTWWHSQTLNTRYHTWRKGVFVGMDEKGNKFYTSKDQKRRWVIFNGEAEASSVCVNWHGWLHYTFDNPPTKEPLVHKKWETPHQPNLTGTLNAYAPPGSLRQNSPKIHQDYEPWSPR